MIKWDNITKTDSEMISQIVNRFKNLIPHSYKIPAIDIAMDVTATHINSPLDLHRLLTFDDQDLMHDVLGIIRHIDRKTGELHDYFLPRSAK